ncbi:hypothetical protein RO575_19720 [Methylomonas sp. MO1]|uniref:hypothetical protein n=1 Tax=Methylomonas sp. MO1 TaxID=3073619 RepID=UPI0028A43E41|nr:hypothetical protein [Methylomonas sp. MO1]MDT4291799.1 hypothetical protein [Methylomonas sp. MO1]
MTNRNTQKNYLAAPDNLQRLTEKFRDGLDEWPDVKNEPKLVSFGGEEKPVLKASVHEILEYAKEFTELWRPIPEEQKNDFVGWVEQSETQQIPSNIQVSLY